VQGSKQLHRKPHFDRLSTAHVGTLSDGILPSKNQMVTEIVEALIQSCQSAIWSSAANHDSSGQHKMEVVLISGRNKLEVMQSI
jgi:hypothetical protein